MTELPANGTPESRRRAWFAVAWCGGFLLLFYSFTLPNSQPRLTRSEFWLLLVDAYVLQIDSAAPDAAAVDAGWKYLPQRFEPLAVAMFLHLAAWSLGSVLLGSLRWRRSDRRLERFVYAAGLGLSGLSLITLGIGLAGWLHRELLLGICFAAIAVEVVWRLREKSSAAEKKTAAGKSRDDRPPSRLPVLCLLVAAPFLLAMLLGALLPSVDFDVKEYHLQGPKEYFQNGRITFLPHNVYTSFPFLTEMLSLAAMVICDDWWMGALAGKAVLMGFAPLTAVALLAAGRRYFSPAAGWLAATIHLSTPWIYRISIIAYAEGGLTFYLFVSLSATLHAIDRFRIEHSVRPFLLPGLLAGSAMACKYPGVLQVVIPMGLVCVAVPFFIRHTGLSPWRQALRLGSLFTLGTLIAVGPWLLKNLAETGNPVYPLMYSLFGGADWDAAMNAKWRAGHSPDHHHIADLGVKLVDVTLKSDWLSPLLFGLAPLALFRSGDRRLAGWLWLYVVFLFLAWWTLTHRIDRFWVPMIPVVSLLAGAGAAWNSSTVWKYGCAVIVAVAVAFNLGYATSPFSGYNGYLTNLSAAKSLATAPSIRLLNRALPADARVLCVGEAQVFDAEFALVYNTVFDRSLFQEWFAEERSNVPAKDLPLRDAKDIRATLQTHGITHVFVNWAEIERYRKTYGYTEFVSRDRFRTLQEMGVLAPSITGDVHPETGKPVAFQLFPVIR